MGRSADGLKERKGTSTNQYESAARRLALARPSLDKPPPESETEPSRSAESDCYKTAVCKKGFSPVPEALNWDVHKSALIND